MELRNYQQEMVELVEGHMMFDCSPCCMQLPTGGGKTVVVSHLIKDLVDSGKDVVFMMNLTSLVGQTAKTLDALGIKYNVVSASYKGKQDGPAAKVTIAMQQTLHSRIDKIDHIKCDVLVVDEMHISHDTTTMNQIKDKLRPTNIVGLSATSIDSKGAKLKNVTIIETETTQDLTKQGYLTPAKTFILKYAQDLDFSDIGSGEDYTDPEVDSKLNNPEYNQAVFDGWLEYRQEVRLKTIGFVSTIEHAESITALFVSNGIKAAAYHSKLSSKVREQLMQDFRHN